MDANQLAKIKAVVSRMGEKYWVDVVERNGALSNQLTQLMDDFKADYIKLVVNQFNILETRYNGYNRLVDATEATALSVIVQESKDLIAGLMQEQHQLVTTLMEMLTELGSMIEAIQTLGEVTPSLENKL